MTGEQGAFNGIRKALANAFFHHKTIDEYIDVMLDVLLKRGNFGDFVGLSVDLNAGEAFFLQTHDFFFELAFFTAGDRCKNMDF